MTQILTDCVVIPLYCFALTSIVYSYVVAFVVISYVTNLLALTLDRYFAIKFPLRYRGIMWRGRCIRVILACWVISTFVQILPVFWNNSDHQHILHKVYLSTITIVFLLLPLCIVIFAYVSIFIEVVSITQKEKKRRVIFKKKEDDDRLSTCTEVFSESRSSMEHLNVEADDTRKWFCYEWDIGCFKRAISEDIQPPPIKGKATATGLTHGGEASYNLLRHHSDVRCNLDPSPLHDCSWGTGKG